VLGVLRHAPRRTARGPAAGIALSTRRALRSPKRQYRPIPIPILVTQGRSRADALNGPELGLRPHLAGPLPARPAAKPPCDGRNIFMMPYPGPLYAGDARSAHGRGSGTLGRDDHSPIAIQPDSPSRQAGWGLIVDAIGAKWSCVIPGGVRCRVGRVLRVPPFSVFLGGTRRTRPTLRNACSRASWNRAIPFSCPAPSPSTQGG
jgi:hypothetical protein